MIHFYHYNYTMSSSSKYVLMLRVDDGRQDLVELYDAAIKRREDLVSVDPLHLDSGFDLWMPKELGFQAWETQIVDLAVSCAAYTRATGGELVPAPFYIYPRSSISKTPFRLANGTGIIDSGYRGNLKGAFDCAKPTGGRINKYSRLLQICMPDLSPFEVRLVRELDRTRRGAGGFGSTGP